MVENGENSGVFYEKSIFKVLGFSFFLKLDWVSYIVSIAKTSSKELELLR